MLKSDDCRKKAALALQDAEALRSPDARAAVRRVAAQWKALANQIEQDAARSLPRRPADLIRKVDTADAADILRARLRLTERSDESNPRKLALLHPRVL